MMRESSVCPESKEIWVFGSFRCFFKNFAKFFEKQSKWTKKLRFLCFWGIHNFLSSFWAKLGYSRIKIDHMIYHLIADSLLKDAALTVGVNLRLCLLSLWSKHLNFWQTLCMQIHLEFDINSKSICCSNKNSDCNFGCHLLFTFSNLKIIKKNWLSMKFQICSNCPYIFAF